MDVSERHRESGHWFSAVIGQGKIGVAIASQHSQDDGIRGQLQGSDTDLWRWAP